MDRARQRRPGAGRLLPEYDARDPIDRELAGAQRSGLHEEMVAEFVAADDCALQLVAAVQVDHCGGSDPRRRTVQPENLGELRRQLETATEALDEHASKELLRAYGLTTTRESAVDTLDDALAAADEG